MTVADLMERLALHDPGAAVGYEVDAWRILDVTDVFVERGQVVIR